MRPHPSLFCPSGRRGRVPVVEKASIFIVLMLRAVLTVGAARAAQQSLPVMKACDHADQRIHMYPRSRTTRRAKVRHASATWHIPSRTARAARCAPGGALPLACTRAAGEVAGAGATQRAAPRGFGSGRRRGFHAAGGAGVWQPEGGNDEKFVVEE